jgi:hypothetical protein
MIFWSPDDWPGDMSRRNRERAMECIAGPGSWLSPGDKLALLMIGDLVKDDEDIYWEAQANLAARTGSSRRSAGRAVRKLHAHGALIEDGWKRTGMGATVKVFLFTPEDIHAEMGATFPPESGLSDSQVGRNEQTGGKKLTPRWEETNRQVGSGVPQTDRNSKEQEKNPDKPAANPLTRTKNQEEIFDNPEALETEKRRQKAALIHAEQHNHEIALVGATHADR